MGDSKATSAYAGSICVDTATLDIMTLDVRDEEIAVPVEASSEIIRYGRTRVGSSDFLLPQYDELMASDLEGNEYHNITRYTACRQYVSHSSISFGGAQEAALASPEKTEGAELPGGISLELKLETPITFEASAVGDPVAARLNRAVHTAGVWIPKGARISGRIRGLEHYYKPRSGFRVSLEFDSAAFDGKRVRFRARLVGPRYQGRVVAGVRTSAEGYPLPADSSRDENGTFDIDMSEPRFGVFRVEGETLRLARGLWMVWETQGAG